MRDRDRERAGRDGETEKPQDTHVPDRETKAGNGKEEGG